MRCQSGIGERSAANTTYKKLKKAAEETASAFIASQDAATNAPLADRASLRALRDTKEDERDAARKALEEFKKKAPEGWAPPVEA